MDGLGVLHEQKPIIREMIFLPQQLVDVEVPFHENLLVFLATDIEAKLRAFGRIWLENLQNSPQIPLGIEEERRRERHRKTKGSRITEEAIESHDATHGCPTDAGVFAVRVGGERLIDERFEFVGDVV